MKKMILTLLLAFPSIAAALPAEPFHWYPNLEKVGSANYSVFFIDVYDIDLYQDRSEEGIDLVKIKYNRALTAERRIEGVVNDFNKMPSLKNAPIKAWETQMKAFFPNVKKGDTISIFKTTDNEAVFYHNGEYKAEITDQNFVKAFFGLWLSKETPNDDLHKRLLKNAFHK